MALVVCLAIAAFCAQKLLLHNQAHAELYWLNCEAEGSQVFCDFKSGLALRNI